MEVVITPSVNYVSVKGVIFAASTRNCPVESGGKSVDMPATEPAPVIRGRLRDAAFVVVQIVSQWRLVEGAGLVQAKVVLAGEFLKPAPDRVEGQSVRVGVFPDQIERRGTEFPINKAVRC